MHSSDCTQGEGRLILNMKKFHAAFENLENDFIFTSDNSFVEEKTALKQWSYLI